MICEGRESWGGRSDCVALCSMLCDQSKRSEQRDTHVTGELDGAEQAALVLAADLGLVHGHDHRQEADAEARDDATEAEEQERGRDGLEEAADRD